MNNPLILTLDIGTSSLRALVYDAQGHIVPGLQAQAGYRVSTTADGGNTLDPAALLSSAAWAIDQVLSQAGPRAGEIGGVAMATLVTNILGVDAEGRPLTPVFTYADTRNAPDAAQLRSELDGQVIHDRTGCLIHSSYLPARFRWLRRTAPEVMDRAARWISIGEFLYWNFFEEYRVSYSAASWTGLLNRRTLAWDQEWLSLLGLDPARLSPLSDVDQPFRGLRGSWAARWPALRDIPWFPALGDGAAANVGSGCATRERVALTIGTTGAMRVVIEETIPAVPRGLWTYRVDRRRALLGGATTEGGNVYAWLRETLRLPEPAVLEEVLARMVPAAHGLVFLPFFAGERAPGWRDDTRAVVSGLTLNTSPVDIVRAGLEAVACRYALIHRLVAPHLPPDHQIIASGTGLLASPAWLQIMADVLGRPVTASAEKEATSRGAALMALESLGVTPAPAALGKTYEPDAGRQERYQAAVEEQVSLYQALFES